MATNTVSYKKKFYVFLWDGNVYLGFYKTYFSYFAIISCICIGLNPYKKLYGQVCDNIKQLFNGFEYFEKLLYKKELNYSFKT